MAALEAQAQDVSAMLILCFSGRATMAEKKEAALKVTMMGAAGQLTKFYIRHNDHAELITLCIGAGTLGVLSGIEAVKGLFGGMMMGMMGGGAKTTPKPDKTNTGATRVPPFDGTPKREGDDAKRADLVEEPPAVRTDGTPA